MTDIRIEVNGVEHAIVVRGAASLLDLLRDDLALPGSKNACEQGECGSCSVILDGELVCSCLVMAADCDGSAVTTVEGLGTAAALHPVQEAFVAHGAVQCGFCTPGFVVATAHLLATDPTPSELDVREALAGNVCRCTGYGAIHRAIAAIVSPDTPAEETP